VDDRAPGFALVHALIYRIIVLVALGLLALRPGGVRAAGDEPGVSSTVRSEVMDPTSITGSIRFYDFRRWHDQNQPYPGQPGRSYDSQGTAVGGDLELKSGELAGFSAGISLFTQHSLIDHASPNRGLFRSPDVTQIAETYLRFQAGRARFTLGRQLMNTPFASSDRYTMLTRSFQGVSAAVDV
jgi:hypothetical protein